MGLKNMMSKGKLRSNIPEEEDDIRDSESEQRNTLPTLTLQ